MGASRTHLFGLGEPFDPVAWGGASGAGHIGATFVLRPAVAGVSVQFVGAVMGGSAGTTSDLGAFNYNGVLSGGLSASTAQDDLVLVPYATGSTADRTLAMSSPSGYATLLDLYQDTATFDVNLSLFWKFMGASPDAGFTLGQTFSTNDAGAYGAYVFRGVDLTTPFDMIFSPTQNVFQSNSAGTPNCPPISPVSKGAAIVCVGAAANGSFASDFTSSDLTSFRARREADTNDVSLGIGHKIWSF
jgi:hypothetical protein